MPPKGPRGGGCASLPWCPAVCLQAENRPFRPFLRPWLSVTRWESCHSGDPAGPPGGRGRIPAAARVSPRGVVTTRHMGARR